MLHVIDITYTKSFAFCLAIDRIGRHPEFHHGGSNEMMPRCMHANQSQKHSATPKLNHKNIQMPVHRTNKSNADMYEGMTK